MPGVSVLKFFRDVQKFGTDNEQLQNRHLAYFQILYAPL